MTQVTVIVADTLISVDGEALEVDYDFPANLWAIQWDGNRGEAEWEHQPNTDITLSYVQPYIDAWQAAKDAQPAPVVFTEQEILNMESRAYLDSTDWYTTRSVDEGIPVPLDIAANRTAARAAIEEETVNV